jgi:major membrane immunogen (membrane-anchored lipoprotein)
MKTRARIIIAALTLLLLTACGGTTAYRDGVFVGTSAEDDTGAYGEVTITIADGEIVDCAFVTWQSDGTVKGENYGKVNGEISNQDYYDKAQLAVDAMSRYAEQLRETKKLSGVDAVSGATNSYDQFTEAVENALDGAKK